MTEENEDKVPFNIMEDKKSVASEDAAIAGIDLNKELSFLKKLPQKYQSKSFLMVFLAGLMFLCLFMGGIMFGGSSDSPAPIGPYLTGIVSNPDVPQGRRRCGTVDRTQGCALYVVNAETRERPAKDLFSIASSMTQVQKFLIETGNLRYANTIIRPGYIAQINIPPIR